MMKFLSKLILVKLLGWKLVGEAPKLKKSVVVFAPHTSWCDGFLGKMYFYIWGVRHVLLMASKYFIWPVNHVFRAFGFIPVGNTGRNALMDTINAINGADEMNVLICPEGHLKKVEKWNPGFYLIAKKCNVPIVLSFIDYKKKEVGILGVIENPGNAGEVWDKIRAAYEGIGPKYPEKFSLPTN